MHLDSVAVSDRGLVRQRNEDSFLEISEEGLFAVADGMGGHAAGDRASHLAIATVEATLARSVEGLLADRLLAAVRTANDAILADAVRHQARRGMGTTLTLLAIRPEGSAIAHVGDSRAYRLRSGALMQLTMDHTVVQREITRGKLSPRSARQHPLRHLLTRALGTEPALRADLIPIDPRAGDLYLLCSDGLSGMVVDDDLEAILGSSDSLAEQGRRLIEAAKLRGGEDNITAVLVRVAEGPPPGE